MKYISLPTRHVKGKTQRLLPETCGVAFDEWMEADIHYLAILSCITWNKYFGSKTFYSASRSLAERLCRISNNTNSAVALFLRLLGSRSILSLQYLTIISRRPNDFLENSVLP